MYVKCGFAIIAERMEMVRQEGVGRGWAGKWLKVDLSYKVWKVTSSSSIMMVLSGPIRSCGLVWSVLVVWSDLVWSYQVWSGLVWFGLMIERTCLV